MSVSELQELCAKNGYRNPEYRLVKTEGSAHSPLFTIKVFLNDVELGEGIAKSKKAAKHSAAQKALTAVREQGLVNMEKEFTKLRVVEGGDQCDNGGVSGAESNELQSTSDSSQVDQNGQSMVGQRNAISILQELCAKNGFNLPSYSQVEQLGSCHEPTFWFNCEVVIGAEPIVGKAQGKTKKAAKIAAAEEVLREIQEKQIPLYTANTKKSRGPGVGTRSSSNLNLEQLKNYKETLDLMESLHMRPDLDALFEANDNMDYCFRFNLIAEKLNCWAQYIPYTEETSRTNKFKCLLQMKRQANGPNQAINRRLPIFVSWGNSPVSIEQAMQKAAQKAIIMVKVLKM